VILSPTETRPVEPRQRVSVLKRTGATVLFTQVDRSYSHIIKPCYYTGLHEPLKPVGRSTVSSAAQWVTLSQSTERSIQWNKLNLLSTAIYISEQVCIRWHKGAYYTAKLTFSNNFPVKVWGAYYTNVRIIFEFLWHMIYHLKLHQMGYIVYM